MVTCSSSRRRAVGVVDFLISMEQRKSCIQGAGGWQHDTLTEDLDLSYRAQLEGWKFIFLVDVVTPAELPVDMNGFKSQQHRWTKGSIQTCKKLLTRIWRSRLPLP